MDVHVTETSDGIILRADLSSPEPEDQLSIVTDEDLPVTRI